MESHKKHYANDKFIHVIIKMKYDLYILIMLYISATVGSVGKYNKRLFLFRFSFVLYLYFYTYSIQNFNTAFYNEIICSVFDRFCII